MKTIQRQGGWIILCTLLIAFVLDSIPLPPWLDHFRPDWLSLVMIYWCMALPHRLGVGSAWTLGLLQDAARGTLLGQNALAMTVVAYMTLKTYRRIRVFPLWQQAWSVLLLLLVKQLLLVWINGVVGYPPRDWWYLAPALGGMLLWPWLFIILRDLRRHFQVS
ncbi:MAG TPA: rod shape-determining protein MreD [Candidatus Competibacteraceae bacterium]|nr:rod shape-determining protein MreD [Candidatus Competibacteraceae bacterium]